MTEKRPIAIVASRAPVRALKSNYPEPFAARVAGRHKQQLGEVFGLAIRALAHVTAAALHRPLAADAAELVAPVPVQLCPALCQDTGLREAELRGGGARLLKTPRFIQIEFMLRVVELRDVDGEMRHAL